MRINPIVCDAQTSYLLHTKKLNQLYQKIDIFSNCPVRYDGKGFKKDDSNRPCELSNKHWWEGVDNEGNPLESYIVVECPLGAENDFLWLQESWMFIEDDVHFESDFLSPKAIENREVLQLAQVIGWQDATKLTLENARLLLKINELKVIKINDIWLWSLIVTVV